MGGISMDMQRRKENLKNGRKLCEHCDGTGNEFYSMYRKCPKCDGKGYISNNTEEE